MSAVDTARPATSPAADSPSGPTVRRRRLPRGLSRWLAPLVVGIGVLVLWDAWVRIKEVSPLVVPAPTDVFARLLEFLGSGRFYGHVGVTMTEFLIGFSIGTIGAIVTGMVMTRFPIVAQGVTPYIVAFQNFPKIALAPLLITWLGFGTAPKIALAAILAYFPVFVNVVTGLRAASKDQLDLMRSLSAGGWQTFRYLQFKVAMPYLFAGLRVAAVLSLLGAIIGEFISSAKGLGYLLLQQNSRLAIDGAFALLIVMAALGLAVNAILTFLHRKVVHWDESLQGDGLSRGGGV